MSLFKPEPLYLTEDMVRKYLSWDTLVPLIEGVICDITEKDETETIQPARLIMPIAPRNGAVLAMPSFSGKQNMLGCKVVSSFRNNAEKGLPSIYGTILLMNADTGKVKMILEAGEITGWRTAAASVVATKHLHTRPKRVLAILGAGVQGRLHALAFQRCFQFSEIRVWNRTFSKAEMLAAEMGSCGKAYESNELCVRGADVIVTATYATEPIVKAEWLTHGVHINAVGFGENHHNELSLDVYRQASIVVDNEPAANKELKGLLDAGVDLGCELGKIIRGVCSLPVSPSFTVFHSLGMSVEDVVTAEYIYKRHKIEQDILRSQEPLLV